MKILNEYSMYDLPRKLTAVLHPLFVAVAVVIAAVGLGGPILTVAETRASSDSEENRPVDERQEESTATLRIDHHRQMKLDERRLAFAFEVPARARLGHTQNMVLFTPNGHRLANGFLAPLTC